MTARPVMIVGDGSIATHGVGEGRMIPVLILDTSERSDIVEYIRIHRFSGPGDVLATWGTLPTRSDTVTLMLQFKRPVDLALAILFELRKAHSILVEGVLRSGGVYIQAGADGDRVRDTLDVPRVLCEIPDTGFVPHWNRICLAYLVNKLRGEGFDRKSAKRLAAEQYEMLQTMAATRPFPS